MTINKKNYIGYLELLGEISDYTDKEIIKQFVNKLKHNKEFRKEISEYVFEVKQEEQVVSKKLLKFINAIEYYILDIEED